MQIQPIRGIQHVNCSAWHRYALYCAIWVYTVLKCLLCCFIADNKDFTELMFITLLLFRKHWTNPVCTPTSASKASVHSSWTPASSSFAHSFVECPPAAYQATGSNCLMHCSRFLWPQYGNEPRASFSRCKFYLYTFDLLDNHTHVLHLPCAKVQ